MNQSLEQELYDRFPEQFRQKDLSVTESCMPWGMECGDGWFPLIRTMCGLIRGHIDGVISNNTYVDKCIAEGKEPPYPRREVPSLEFVQVKEKFGELCAYYDGGDDFMAGVVSMAESMSAITCEQCGNAGKRRGGGWIVTLCDECDSGGNEKENP